MLSVVQAARTDALQAHIEAEMLHSLLETVATIRFHGTCTIVASHHFDNLIALPHVRIDRLAIVRQFDMR